MCSAENENSGKYHEMMHLRTIRGYTKREYGYMIAVSDTRMVSTATKINHFPGADTQNGGVDGYIIFKTVVSRERC